MADPRGSYRWGSVGATVAVIGAVTLGNSCTKDPVPDRPSAPSAVLRVGVAQLSATDQGQGLRQLTQLLAVESLMRTGDVAGQVAELLAVG